MIFTPFCPPHWGGPRCLFPRLFWAVAPGFHIPAANKQTTIWTVLVTTIMSASPNDQTPRPTSAFIAISRCPAGSEGKPIQDQRKENGNAEAHPLARGEHSDRTTQNDLQQGSSPLARGTRRCLAGCEPAGGLIPAHTGNTTISLPFWRGFQAHPRSRGEHMCQCPASFEDFEPDLPPLRGPLVGEPTLGAPPGALLATLCHRMLSVRSSKPPRRLLPVLDRPLSTLRLLRRLGSRLRLR